MYHPAYETISIYAESAVAADDFIVGGRSAFIWPNERTAGANP